MKSLAVILSSLFIAIPLCFALSDDDTCDPHYDQMIKTLSSLGPDGTAGLLQNSFRASGEISLGIGSAALLLKPTQAPMFFRTAAVTYVIYFSFDVLNNSINEALWSLRRASESLKIVRLIGDDAFASDGELQKQLKGTILSARYADFRDVAEARKKISFATFVRRLDDIDAQNLACQKHSDGKSVRLLGIDQIYDLIAR
jgi:hypothetical protein